MNINLNAEDVPEGWIVVDDAWGNTVITAQANEEHGRGSVRILWGRGRFELSMGGFGEVPLDRAGWRRGLTQGAIQSLKANLTYYPRKS